MIREHSARETQAPGAPGPQGTIPLATPDLGEIETAAVMEALQSGFVSSVGPAVDEFETAFARTVGTKHAVACATGTAALHVALRLVGVERGSEVMCSDFTFIGSANPIAYEGAVPVFIDSEESTWNMDPNILSEELDNRARSGRPMPAAIELVHVLGQPAHAAEVLEAAAKYDIPVVEDAAESLGAGWSGGSLAGHHTGSVGQVGAFSFNGNKIATAGGGGMIVTNDDELARRARHLTTQAKVPDVGYLHDEVGYNYRLTNLAAALGNAQLSRLPEFVSARRATAAAYDAAFADLPITLPPRLDGFDATYWLYSMLCDNLETRDELLAYLSQNGVGARALWRPLHQQPAFAGVETLGGAVGASFFERGISLPSSSHLATADRDKVISVVQSFFGTR